MRSTLRPVEQRDVVSAVKRRRGQAAALAAAGAPASFYSFASRRSDPPAPRPVSLFFCAHFPDPDPAISISWRRSWAGSRHGWNCYRVTGAVTFAVTAKPLFLNGFQGCYRSYRKSALLYTYASACARTSVSLSFSVTLVTYKDILYISDAYLLPTMLPGASLGGNTVTLSVRRSGAASTSNKIAGGYRSAARQLVDLRPIAGSAPRNFRAFGARLVLEVGSIGSSSAGATWSGGNGGFLPLSVGGSGAVGTMMLERSAHRVEIARLSGSNRLLGQQARRITAAVQGAPGADRRDPPAPPPIAFAHSLGCSRRLLAGFGSPFGHDCLDQVGRPLNSFGRTGWGVRAVLARLAALQGLAERLGAGAGRVGDGEPSSERLAPKFGETLKLWGGRTHVNA